MYRNDDAVMAAAHPTTQMAPERSATLAAAPSKATSPHKRFLRIDLPTRVTLPGLAMGESDLEHSEVGERLSCGCRGGWRA